MRAESRQVAVAISDVRKTYAGAAEAALRGVSLDIFENEFFTLLGPSGCGKTTLLRMIGGFEHPDSGSIALHGVPMGQTPPNQRPVNTVFQSYALFPHMTVQDNIAFALEMLNQPRERIRQRVDAIMRLVQLEALAQRKPGQLSGGQQQRVALGRALAPAPKVLLLDEPLSALDLKLRREMQVELKRLQTATGITFVFVTHDQEEALTMSNRMAVMNQGQLMQVGTPSQIYEQPANRFVAAFIGETNFLPAVCLRREGAGAVFALGAPGTPDTVGAPQTELSVADGGSAQAGAAVVLAVRPEKVLLGPVQAGWLHATVQDMTYNGSHAMVQVGLLAGVNLRAQLPSTQLAQLALGQAVAVQLAPEAVRVFAA